jgi:hypothetical protein
MSKKTFDADAFAKSVGAKAHKADKKEIEQRLKALRQKVAPYISKDVSGTITTKEIRDFEKLLKEPFDKFYQQIDGNAKEFNRNHAIAQQISRLYAKMDDKQKNKYKTIMKKKFSLSENLSENLNESIKIDPALKKNIEKNSMKVISAIENSRDVVDALKRIFSVLGVNFKFIKDPRYGVISDVVVKSKSLGDPRAALYTIEMIANFQKP